MATDSSPTLASLARDLSAGRITSHMLVAGCLERISAADGEGSRTFLKVHAEQALSTADFYDQSRRRGALFGPFAGIPVSIKDLFDLAGDTTTSASTVLRDAPAALADCPAVARLKAAGFVVIGRTNMTEFAFSGLGLNPHYGTPLNPWDRATGRIPGGSSSGAAVCITDGMAFGALGTDTGGSCRIPAALCGIVGFKPTAHRVPKSGVYPLSTTLDSVGSLARSVTCCRALDAVLAGDASPEDLQALVSANAGSERTAGDVRGLRLGVLSSYVVEGIASPIAAAYQRALRELSAAGAILTDVLVPELNDLPHLNRNGGIAAAEAYALHRARLNSDASRYDPRVASRIMRAREQDAADYIELLRARAVFIERVSRRLMQFDAVIMPTVPVVAPAISELATDDVYVRTNAMVLRNSSVVNFLDGCAISLPCHEPGSAPAGLTLFGLRDADQRLWSVASAVERCLQDPLH
ncbi:MAG TPA: amidase [Steroidobacteraceae bacterium]|jgi:aspartyl-tRNA(Asn)/glutamyl-tRNA(Gln) amidotransferase subunit A